MEIYQSVFGEIAKHEGATVQSVDIGSLVRRLILFDRVIVRSVRLREMPELVRVFGKSGIQDLFASGFLKLNCEFVSLITDIHRNGVRHLPLEQFSFGTVDATNRESDLRKELGALRQISGLKNQDRAQIEDAVWNSMLRPPATFASDFLAQFDSDVRQNNPLLRHCLLTPLREATNRQDIRYEDLKLSVEEVKTRTFRIINNFGSDFHLSQKQSHDLLQSAVAAASNLTFRLAEMENYSALIGFRESEAPLLFGRLAPIFLPQNPAGIETQFERIIRIIRIPDFSPGQKVSVKKLLEVRESPECREFRSWIQKANMMTDSEIKEYGSSIRSLIGNILDSPMAKVTRFATTTLAGFVPGLSPILTTVGSAFDTFVVDKLFPISGIIAFLNDYYPSVYKD